MIQALVGASSSPWIQFVPLVAFTVVQAGVLIMGEPSPFSVLVQLTMAVLIRTMATFCRASCHSCHVLFPGQQGSSRPIVGRVACGISLSCPCCLSKEYPVGGNNIR
jgi:hypothetical protein